MASLRHLVPLHTSNPKLKFLGTGLNGARTGVNFVIWHCFFLCSRLLGIGLLTVVVGNFWNFIVTLLELLADETVSYFHYYYFVVSTSHHVV